MRATVPSRNFFISLFSNRSFSRRRFPAPSMAGVRQLSPKMLSPIGHSDRVPNLLMELEFRMLTDALITRARQMASAKAAADLVPHVLTEGFSARGPVFLVDIEAVEDVEIFKDRISIACHRQYAKEFARRSARAFDLPSAYRVGAVADGEATQLRHVGR